MSRGHDRERAVKAYSIERDWLAFRAPASLGVADVIALKDGERPHLIEVKSTAQGPYEHFGPADRHRLSLAAHMAGAVAVLAWWPSRGKLVFIPESEWPAPRLTDIREAA
jgi:Holliday junction resolvase